MTKEEAKNEISNMVLTNKEVNHIIDIIDSIDSPVNVKFNEILLPSPEDIKRWYQLLVGKSEIEMQMNMIDTFPFNNVKPEPSRLEIAAMMMQGMISDSITEGTYEEFAQWSFEYADALIAASKEGEK